MAANKTIVLITGANTGLGYQMVRALCQSTKSYQILVGGRSLEKAQAAVQKVQAEFPQTSSSASAVQIDIENDESIEKAFQLVQDTYGRLDALVNNAGTQLDQQLTAGKMTMRQVWTQSWTVNVVGTQLATHAFVPLLLKSADPRIIFLASGTSSLGGSENAAMPFNKVFEKGWPKTGKDVMSSVPAYRSAKTGMNMMMREWHRVLKNDGVKVWGTSPGYLATGLGGSQENNKAAGAGDPSLAGTFVRSVLEGERDGDAGKVILRDSVQAW